jgi:hypothetical protein
LLSRKTIATYEQFISDMVKYHLIVDYNQNLGHSPPVFTVSGDMVVCNRVIPPDISL